MTDRLARSAANAIREDLELVDVRPARDVGGNDGDPSSNGERDGAHDHRDRNEPAECFGHVNESTPTLSSSVPLNPRMYDHTRFI